MNNGQSAAKLLLNGEGSTTIPRKGSTIDKILLEKPDFKLNKLFDSYCYDKDSCIYVIYTLNNDVCYVGSTLCLQKRLRKHRDRLRRNFHHSIWMQRVYNKYGKDNFYYGVLEYTEDLKDKEVDWIKCLDSFLCGYNSTEDTSKNFYDQDLINNNIKLTSKPVVALSKKGEFLEEFSSVSEAAREFNTSNSNISRCCRGKFRYIKDRIFVYKEDYDPKKSYSVIAGYKKPDHYKRTMSKIMKGRTQTKEHRYNLAKSQGKTVICLTDGKEFISLRECGRNYNLSPSSIRRAIKQKRHCKGLLFKFKEDIV